MNSQVNEVLVLQEQVALRLPEGFTLRVVVMASAEGMAASDPVVMHAGHRVGYLTEPTNIRPFSDTTLWRVDQLKKAGFTILPMQDTRGSEPG